MSAWMSDSVVVVMVTGQLHDQLVPGVNKVTGVAAETISDKVKQQNSTIVFKEDVN